MLHAPSPAGRWGKIKQMGGLARVKHLTNSTSVWKTYSCSLTLIWLKTFTLQRDEEMLSCILNMTAILWLVGEKFVCAVVARWMNQFGIAKLRNDTSISVWRADSASRFLPYASEPQVELLQSFSVEELHRFRVNDVIFYLIYDLTFHLIFNLVAQLKWFWVKKLFLFWADCLYSI